MNTVAAVHIAVAIKITNQSRMSIAGLKKVLDPVPEPDQETFKPVGAFGIVVYVKLTTPVGIEDPSVSVATTSTK